VSKVVVELWKTTSALQRLQTTTNGCFQEVQFNDLSQAILTSGRNHDNPAITDTIAHAHCPLATCVQLAHR